jgi:hypothetical protein
MEIPLSATGEPVEEFDLVELVEPAEGFPAGERGTVVVIGISSALVDFRWKDGNGGPQRGCTRVVSYERLRIVCHRRDEAST